MLPQLSQRSLRHGAFRSALSTLRAQVRRNAIEHITGGIHADDTCITNSH
jgi:hypothetical protein